MSEFLLLLVLCGVLIVAIWCISCIIGHLKAVQDRRTLLARNPRDIEASIPMGPHIRNLSQRIHSCHDERQRWETLSAFAAAAGCSERELLTYILESAAARNSTQTGAGGGGGPNLADPHPAAATPSSHPTRRWGDATEICQSLLSNLRLIMPAAVQDICMRRNEQANVNVVQVQAEQAPPWLQSLADISYLEDLIGIAALDTRPSSQTIVDGLYTPSTSPPAYTLVVDGALDKPPSYSALFQETNKSRKPARDKMSTSNEESIQNIMANSSCSTSTSAARVPPDGADTTLTSLAGSALCIKEFDQHAESV